MLAALKGGGEIPLACRIQYGLRHGLAVLVSGFVADHASGDFAGGAAHDQQAHRIEVGAVFPDQLFHGLRRLTVDFICFHNYLSPPCKKT